MTLTLRCAHCLAFCFLSTLALAQVRQKIREHEKRFQFSLFPGISTNGISSASYFNKVSINLFGGLSAGNTLIEVGGISNANLKTSNGIQLAGLANVIGANAFVNLSQSEERQLILKENFRSNFIGIQLAGALNYVRDHATGIELTGGLNVVGQDFNGFQLAGFGNSAGGHMGGVQLAGFYNVAHKSAAGFQISSIFNYTSGQLTGVQVGLVNRARVIKGKRSSPPTPDRGLQLGILNMSKEMDGWQVGLVNFGGEIKGLQFGLINFFDPSPPAERTKAGIPIALLNFGSKGSVFRASFNELFDVNLEYTTGNCSNCTRVFGSEMPYEGPYKIFNQNALILSFDPLGSAWAFGYGFERILLNRFVTYPHRNNERKLLSYGLDRKSVV